MKIAVSIGDMNGIGLECFVKALMELDSSKNEVEFVLFGPKNIIKNYLNQIDINYQLQIGNIDINGFTIEIIDIPYEGEIQFGELTVLAGKIAAESIYSAAEYVKEGKANCLLTLPINKKSISLTGFSFPGHTEMLGEYYTSDPLMILFAGALRVALVTVHEPISQIAHILEKPLIERKYQSFEHSLRQDFGIEKPRIALLGLNPHAGEQGNIGTEELDYLNQTVEDLNLANSKSEAVGPFPADGFFGFGEYKKYDGVLAMYHDQGLIPLKLMANGGGVNFTANLPIVRISPDHGTAFPIAGKGLADPKSTLEAIEWGIRISKNRAKFIKD